MLPGAPNMPQYQQFGAPGQFQQMQYPQNGCQQPGNMMYTQPQGQQAGFVPQYNQMGNQFPNQNGMQVYPQMPSQPNQQQMPQTFNPQMQAGMQYQQQPMVNQQMAIPQQQQQQQVAQINGPACDAHFYPQLAFQMNQQQVEQDAQQIRQATKGFGTDVRSLIAVLRKHTWEGRVQITKMYEQQYGLNLLRELQKELSGNLEKLFMGAFDDRFGYWAKEIHEAISYINPDTHQPEVDPKHLIELIFTMSDIDHPKVDNAYSVIYRKSMYSDICRVISDNDWGRLVRAWLRSTNTKYMDPQQAADQLWNAARGMGTDEDVFIMIFCQANPQNFQQIAQCFQQKYGKTLRDIIKKEFSFFSEYAFLLAHDFLINWQEAVAFLLNKAMKGAGTDDESLVHATVLYSDYMKGDIIRRAYTKYGDVQKAIKSDLTGKYEEAVLAMWAL